MNEKRNLTIIGFTIGLLIGEATAWYFTNQAWERDAVMNDVGTWVFYEDTKGNVSEVFQWRKPNWLKRDS